MKKYKLTDETIVYRGFKLYRIVALIDFNDVEAGQKGGFVASEKNLSNDGLCWVYDNAKVYGDAKICGDAKVYGDAEVFGNAWVYGDALICGDAKVYGDAEVFGNAWVYGDALIFGDAEVSCDRDYIVFKNWWSSGQYFTWTRSNNMWKVDFFYGTGDELIKKAYKDNAYSGREYERVVRYVESILADEEKQNNNQNGN